MADTWCLSVSCFHPIILFSSSLCRQRIRLILLVFFPHGRSCSSISYGTHRQRVNTLTSMHRQRMGDPLEQTRSGLEVASSVDTNAGDKRHLENNDEFAFNRSGPQIIILSPQRQGKTIRRDYNVNIASPKGMQVETVAPVRRFLDENGGEGNIGDQEMDVPTASSTSFLGRISDIHAADPFRSIPYATSSTTGGSSSLPPSPNPALMVKIDTPGMPTTSNSSSQSASIPVPPPAKQPKQNGISNSSGPSMPFPKPMAEFKRQLVQNGDTADVTMREFEQPRLKGVIGWSGNQITVNGVTILTGKGYGEQQGMSRLQMRKM
jgi:hypothetical protein